MTALKKEQYEYKLETLAAEYSISLKIEREQELVKGNR